MIYSYLIFKKHGYFSAKKFLPAYRQAGSSRCRAR